MTAPTTAPATAPAPRPLFDLTLTDEQRLMRESVRKFVASVVRPSSRRSDERAEAPEGFYDRTLELGFLTVQLPEAIGGLGAPRSPLSNMLIAEDLAYGDMALAIGALAPLSFVNTVLDQGTDAQRESWLSPFASERFERAALAVVEPGVRFDPRKLATRATRNANGYVLRGSKTLVPFAESASQLLVIAEVEGEGPAAFRITASDKGITRKREAYMGLRALELGSVTLEDVQVSADARLGDGRFDFDRMLDLCRIGSAALAVGVGEAVLEYVKAYANERVAFGEPISHRQSVAFMIADIAIELDGLRLLTYRAAARAEQGLPFRREAYLAQLQAAEKGMKIGTDGVQLLGGHGFIREHMVELWYRNLRAVALLDGCIGV